MLTELISALKKIRATAGELATVEPSTGSEPITKACANATCGRDRTGIQLKASKKLKLRATITSRRNGLLLLAPGPSAKRRCLLQICNSAVAPGLGLSRPERLARRSLVGRANKCQR